MPGFFDPLPSAGKGEAWWPDKLLRWLRTVAIAPRAIFATSGTIENLTITGQLAMDEGGGITTRTTEGQHIEMNGDSTQTLQFFTGDADEIDPGGIFALSGGTSATETLALQLVGPSLTDDGVDGVRPLVSLTSESRNGTSTPVRFEVGIYANATNNVSPPEFKLTDDFIMMLEDGTSTAPSLTFNNASSSGLYKIAASQDFGVAVNNAAVARFGNGYIGPWTTWSPTNSNITVGSGSVTARYQQIGNTINFIWWFALGSGSAVGTGPTFTLPVELSASWPTFAHIGHGYIQAAGTQYTGLCGLTSTTVARPLLHVASATHTTIATLTATVPGTFTSGDDIVMIGTYECV